MLIKTLNIICKTKMADMNNKYGPNIGSGISVFIMSTNEDYAASFPDCPLNSVVVDFDFMDDEVNSDIRAEFADEIFEFFDSICQPFINMEYEQVGEHDGSGGGLIYGCSVYHK